MEEVAISEFKAKCLALIDRVQKTRQGLRITKRGKPVAELVPTAVPPTRAERIGSMKKTFELLDDIVSPAVAEDEWEVMRD